MLDTGTYKMRFCYHEAGRCKGGREAWAVRETQFEARQRGSLGKLLSISQLRLLVFIVGMIIVLCNITGRIKGCMRKAPCSNLVLTQC